MFIINPYVFNASEDLLLDLYSDSIGAWSVSRLLSSDYKVTPSTTKLLDTYSDSIGAWSVSRKLRTAYTGGCIKVREDGGDTVADIGFDGNGDLDETALLLHCGVNSGFVHTLYDQGTTSNDGVQTTASSQPRIVLNGVVEKSNGKPAMFFDGVNDYFDCGQLNGGTKPANYSVLNVYETYPTGDSEYIYGSFNSGASGLSPWVHIIKGDTTIRHDFSDGVGVSSHTASTPIVANTQGLFQVSYTNGNTAPVIRHDGSELTLTPIFEDATSCAGTEYGFSIGRPGEWNNKYYEGLQSEIIAFNVDNLANTAAIENNINTHYNTY
jgi:hypothetical protein